MFLELNQPFKPLANLPVNSRVASEEVKRKCLLSLNRSHSSLQRSGQLNPNYFRTRKRVVPPAYSTGIGIVVKGTELHKIDIHAYLECELANMTYLILYILETFRFNCICRSISPWYLLSKNVGSSSEETKASPDRESVVKTYCFENYVNNPEHV